MTTSTDLVIRDRQEIVRLDTEQIKFLAHTEFVPEKIRGNLPAIFATIATGREIGIGDMASLRHIHIIDGKPGYSAEIMVVLARREGHSITTVGEITATSVTVKGTRGDNGDEMTYTFTAEMADRAGLSRKRSHQQYPESMLWARAVSQLCRMLFADCFAGATYTAEELGDEHTESAGEPQSGDHVPVSQDTPAASLSDMAASDPASPADDLPEALQGDTEPKLITAAQAKKLNVLVGALRKAERDPTGWIYARFARAAAVVPASENEDRLHWAAIRDRLTRIEATDLIDKLSEFEAKL